VRPFTRIKSGTRIKAKALNADDVDQTDFRGFFIGENPRRLCNPRSKDLSLFYLFGI